MLEVMMTLLMLMVMTMMVLVGAGDVYIVTPPPETYKCMGFPRGTLKPYKLDLV
jgi:hypothetical protein